FARELQRFVDGDGGGGAGVGHFVHGEAEDVAVDGGHALHAPMLGGAGDLLVHLGDVLDGAVDELGDEGVALGLFLGVEGVVVRVDGFVDGLPPRVPQIQDL